MADAKINGGRGPSCEAAGELGYKSSGARQSGGGKAMCQKFGDGVSNSTGV